MGNTSRDPKDSCGMGNPIFLPAYLLSNHLLGRLPSSALLLLPPFPIYLPIGSPIHQLLPPWTHFQPFAAHMASVGKQCFTPTLSPSQQYILLTHSVLPTSALLPPQLLLTRACLSFLAWCVCCSSSGFLCDYLTIVVLLGSC